MVWKGKWVACLKLKFGIAMQDGTSNFQTGSWDVYLEGLSRIELPPVLHDNTKLQFQATTNFLSSFPFYANQYNGIGMCHRFYQLDCHALYKVINYCYFYCTFRSTDIFLQWISKLISATESKYITTSMHMFYCTKKVFIIISTVRKLWALITNEGRKS